MHASAENRQVAGEANGHLFEQLLRVKGYGDVEAARLLRDGALAFCSGPVCWALVQVLRCWGL